MDSNSPNKEQIEYWSEQAGPKWVSDKAALDGMISPYGAAVMERAKLSGNESVLDVGCGTGQATLQLAARVPNGRVLGVDISSSMLAHAKEVAATEKVSNVSFELADAQIHAFPPASFDLIFSRFGVMFFADPIAAFSNLRTGLKPSGRLRFVCWQPLDQNPWMHVPLGVVVRVAQEVGIKLPPPPEPGAPGPLSLGDPDRLRKILGGAGFGDLEIDDKRISLAVGGDRTVESAVHSAMNLGPAARVLADVTPEHRDVIRDVMRTELETYMTADGVYLDSACWLVSAASA